MRTCSKPFFMKKNITPGVLFRRPLALLLLGIALLVQSCSKESETIAPKPTVSATEDNVSKLDEASIKKAQELGVSVSKTFPATRTSTTTATVYTDNASGVQGSEITITWPDFNYGGPQATATTVRFELVGPAHLVMPAILIESAFGPVGGSNSFLFSIPGYLPTGQYQVIVTTIQANTSLIHDTGNGVIYDRAEGILNITSGTVQNAGQRMFAYNFSNIHPAPNVFGNSSFEMQWPELGVLNGKVRFTMQNVNTGVYYAPAPSSQQQQSDVNAYYSVTGSGTGFYGVNNIFNGQDGYGKVNFNRDDIPTGTYRLYLDQYGVNSTASTKYYTSPTYSL